VARGGGATQKSEGRNEEEKKRLQNGRHCFVRKSHMKSHIETEDSIVQDLGTCNYLLFVFEF
jgi:hypothetical protein